MVTAVVRKIDMQGLRVAIADMLGIPSSTVLEFGKQQDVSAMPTFVMVRKTPSKQLSTHKTFNKLTEVQQIESQKETDIIVSFHGKGAMEMAEYFESTLITEQAYQLFDMLDIGLVRQSAINDLTIPFGGGYEERAEIQITLSHSFIVKHKQNRIDTVNIGLVLNQ